MARQFTLNKKERLKSRKKISALFSKGKKISISPFLVYYMIHPLDAGTKTDIPLQMGAGVSSRFFKKAVDRNRVKRLIRETYRLQNTHLKTKLELSGKSMEIFIIYTDKSLPEYEALSVKMHVVLQKLTALPGKNEG